MIGFLFLAVIVIAALFIAYNNGWFKKLNLDKKSLKRIKLRGITISVVFLMILGIFWIWRGSLFITKPDKEALSIFMQAKFIGMSNIFRGIMLIAAGILTLGLFKLSRYLVFIVSSIEIMKTLNWFLTLSYMIKNQGSLMSDKYSLLSPYLRYPVLLNSAIFFACIAVIIYFTRPKVKQQFK